MLHEHSVLTTDHLARLGFTSLRTAQQRLQLLHRLGVLDRFQPYRPSGSAPLHHLLGPVGARILAAEEGLDIAALGYRRQRSLAVAHRLSLGHDIGVATSIIDLATHPELRLTRWWSAARCARLYGHHTRPDAYLTLTTRTPTESPPRMSAGAVGWWEMFYEYDTGTENLTTLAAKLAGYHRLAAATGIPTPVGFWITRPRREPHARHALTGAHHALPHPQLLMVLTGTPQLDLDTAPADAHGLVGVDQTAAGAVWLPLHPHPRHPGGGRWTLTELAAAVARTDESRGRAHPREPDTGSETWDLGPGGRIELPAPDPYPPPDLPPPTQTAPPASRPSTPRPVARRVPRERQAPSPPGTSRPTTGEPGWQPGPRS